MREFSHDKLHELMDADPQIKESSDQVHALPTTESLDDHRAQKTQMVELFAGVAGCGNVEGAREELEEVYAVLRSNFGTYSQWRDAPNKDHLVKIRSISQDYLNRKICHTPRGGDYVCFCDEVICRP